MYIIDASYMNNIPYLKLTNYYKQIGLYVYGKRGLGVSVSMTAAKSESHFTNSVS